MSATIVRIEGEIIHHQPAIDRLISFLKQQETPHMLVITAYPELYQAIGREIGKVHDSGYSPESLTAFLDSLTHGPTINSGSGEYHVLSARLTDLLKGIHLTGDYSPALKDQVLSYSEQLTAWLLAEKLRLSGVKPAVLTPEQCGLKVTPDYGNATFLSLDHPELIHNQSAELVIIPGSFGITSTGRLARTGRSAADYTAAFLASRLRAERLVLWNLKVEFTSADHDIVPQAGILKRLTYAEASELSYFEHVDFHPRTVEPLLESHTPIHVISAAREDAQPHTIINSEDFISEQVVKSIAATDDLSVLKLNGPGVGLKPGILAEITGKLSDHSINIKSVITSQVSINILLDRKSGPEARRIAGELGFTSVNEIALLDDVTLVAIVGHGMQDHWGISATLFSAVASAHINVILSGSGASDLVSYLVIKTTDKRKCVRAVYDAFFQS